MDKATKKKALELLARKRGGAGITYSDIALETGYSERQLMRLSKRIGEEGADAALAHGNSGSRPRNWIFARVVTTRSQLSLPPFAAKETARSHEWLPGGLLSPLASCPRRLRCSCRSTRAC